MNVESLGIWECHSSICNLQRLFWLSGPLDKTFVCLSWHTMLYKLKVYNIAWYVYTLSRDSHHRVSWRLHHLTPLSFPLCGENTDGSFLNTAPLVTSFSLHHPSSCLKAEKNHSIPLQCVCVCVLVSFSCSLTLHCNYLFTYFFSPTTLWDS